MTRMPPTLADVAKEAGVSPATASRVLNGSAHPVRDTLRQKVLRAAEQLRFVPNANARALAQSSTYTVGVIIHDVSDPYFAEIARGILRQADQQGRMVMLCNTYRDPERELAYVKLLRAHKVEAIIMAGSGLIDAYYSLRIREALEDFSGAGGQVVLIGRHQTQAASVLFDNAHGGRLVAEHLLDLGHQHVAILGGPSNLTSTKDRLEGFEQTWTEHGLPLRQLHVEQGDFTRDGGYAITLKVLERAPQVTAIFALNDAMAVGALAALRERGLRVPHDVSLVGFDDVPLARDLYPALTTVRLPLSEAGEQALHFALGSDVAADATLLAVELIVRDSSGAANGTGGNEP